MKITEAWLEEKNACKEGIEWFSHSSQNDPVAVLRLLISEDRLDWANWLIVRVMTRQQYLSYAIFAAEQVLLIFEKEYPKDDRPRKAIEAARKVLLKDTAENKVAAESAGYAAWYAARYAGEAAWYAAESAGYAAWYAARYAWYAAWYAARYAWYAAESAWYAAESAWYAAESAGYAAWYAAESAGYAAWYAARYAGEAAKTKMQIKILEYGMTLLGKAL